MKKYFLVGGLLIVIPLAACSKEKSDGAVQAAQSSSKSAYEQVLEDRERNSRKNPNNPSVCKNNPQSYLYLKIGDEVFRTTKDSAIYISSVAPDHMRKHKKMDTDIPEGCEGNPYIYPDAFIEIRHKSEDPEWQKIEFETFLLLDASQEEQKYIYTAQKFIEGSFDFYKTHGKSCVHMSDHIEKCFSVNPDGSENFPKGYRVNNYFVAGRPYVLNCEADIGGPRCHAGYRLYPSVDFSYSFYLRLNKHWDERNIVLFDQYLRATFESIRVKN